MKKKKITFVSDDNDWEGLYINGKLVMENHRLDWDDILDAIGVEYETIVADDEWLAEHGTLPDKLSDVKARVDE